MVEYIREVPLAAMLGYGEIEEFRRAVARGDIPAPAFYLSSRKRKPMWLKDDIDRWLGRQHGAKDKSDFLQLVAKVK